MNKINPHDPAGDYLDHLLIGNRTKCSAIAKDYLNETSSVIDLYENVLKKALYDVGTLWETNKITVATEHLSTAITEGVLNELFDQVIAEKRVQKKVVVACVENEKHQVGIKMVADVFEMHGWESFFLGGGIPLSELIPFIISVKPDVFALSLSVYFNYLNLEKMLQRITSEFPTLEIILGGQAISAAEESNYKNFRNVTIISNLYQLEKYIQTYPIKK